MSLSSGNPFTLIVGARADFAIQCWTRGGRIGAIFAATDILTAALWPLRGAASLFVPTIGWYTANGTQSGYGQGQVLASFTYTQLAGLQATAQYVLVVQRAPAGTPANVDAVAIVKFDCKAPSWS